MHTHVMNVRENQKKQSTPTQFGIVVRLLSSYPRSRLWKQKDTKAQTSSGSHWVFPQFEACELPGNGFVENQHVVKSEHLCTKDLVLGMPTGHAGFVLHMHIGVAPSSLFSECCNVLENCSNLLEPETVHLEIHANTVTCSLGESAV